MKGLKEYLKAYKNPIVINRRVFKYLTLGFRLYGNIFAGEVLLGLLAGTLFCGPLVLLGPSYLQ